MKNHSLTRRVLFLHRLPRQHQPPAAQPREFTMLQRAQAVLRLTGSSSRIVHSNTSAR